MTERNRFLLKQFAGEASNNGVFGSYEAGTPTVSDDPTAIQSLPAYETGWKDATTSGSKLPRLEEMQGLQKLFCQAIKELYSEGIPLWMAGETYYLNSLCVYFDEDNDFGLYKNITGNNGNNIPPVDTTNWVKLVIDGADKDLSNLSSTGKNISNWSTNVSNCITEIPQDIKLELNNGVLTRKAGSKMYVPNGPGVFDEVVDDSDFVYNLGIAPDGQYLIFKSQHYFSLTESNCVSGATDSKAGQDYHSWFDTTNNLVKQYWTDGSTPAITDSLPVAIITISGNVITSIDQVFNGFGYIGSTVFALPGVEGRIPNGRNEDGSLKSINWICKRIVVRTFSTDDNFFTAVLGFNGSSLSRLSRSSYSYNQSENYSYNNADVWNYTYIGYIDITAGVISNFNIKTPFHAVDYNDTEFISHQAMPSDRYINWTLLASGQTYTAPADGLIFLNKTVGTADSKIEMHNITTDLRTITPTGGLSTTSFVYCSIQVNKGDIVKINYTVTGVTNKFCFIYNNGSK